jgi:hypothetical protein
MPAQGSSIHRAGAPLLLWVGVLLPPLAFLADLEAGYALAAPACADGAGFELLASSALAALLATGGGLLAWRVGTRRQREQPHGSDALRRGHLFLAIAGAVLAAGSVLLIVAMALARVLQGCE